MTIKQLQMIAPPLAGIVLAVALLFVLAASRMFRKSRTDSYWRRRRTAGQQGWRLLVSALFLMFVSGMVCSISGVAGLVLRTNETPTAVAFVPTDTATATQPPTVMITPTPTIFVPTSAPLATDLPTDTSTPLPSQTPPPTATFTPPSTTQVIPTNTARALTITVMPIITPTITPTITPAPGNLADPTVQVAAILPQTAPLQSSVTPASNASLKITALDYEISGALGPVKPATTFASGFNRIYYFVNFANMQSGVVWRGVLLWNGTVIEHYERLWGTMQNGNGYFFFGQENGFEPGQYEIRLYLGEAADPAATAAFRVETR